MTPPNPDPETVSWVRVLIAFVTVAGLLAALGFVLKYIKIRGFVMPGLATGNKRLEIVESLPIDVRRRLVIVKCDSAEHLLLLSANQDIVVEANLQSKPPS